MYYGETDDTPAFPDILAVDPKGCGCTECATGEYVNEDTYTEQATKGDLLRLINGEVGLNTYNDDPVASSSGPAFTQTQLGSSPMSCKSGLSKTIRSSQERGWNSTSYCSSPSLRSLPVSPARTERDAQHASRKNFLFRVAPEVEGV